VLKVKPLEEYPSEQGRYIRGHDKFRRAICVIFVFTKRRRALAKLFGIVNGEPEMMDTVIV